MTQETYNTHLQSLADGHIVVIGGRSAHNEAGLKDIIRYNGDTLPGEEAEEPQGQMSTGTELVAKMNGLTDQVETLERDNHALQSRVDRLGGEKRDLLRQVNALKAELGGRVAAKALKAAQSATVAAGAEAAKLGLPVASTDVGQSQAEAEAAEGDGHGQAALIDECAGGPSLSAETRAVPLNAGA